MLIRGSRAEIAVLTLVVLTITACSPVWFLTRSDEIVLPLRLEDGLSQSVSFVPKFPRRRYGLFLRFEELSRSVLKFAERGGRASYPRFTAMEGIPT
jgi:hypothetical protein